MTAKDQSIVAGHTGGKGIAFQVEVLQGLRCFQLVLNSEASHQTTGAFGKEADDFELPIFMVLEHALDHPRLLDLAVYGFEIFLRGQIDDDRVFFFGQLGIQVLGELRTPELIQVVGFPMLERRAHLEAIRLHQI